MITIVLLLLGAPPPPPPSVEWLWVSAPRAELHASPATSARVVGVAPQGSRVRVVERKGEGTATWLHVIHAVTVDGWIPAWDAAESRALKPPAISPPPQRLPGTGAAPARIRTPVDHRALDNETAIAGTAAQAPEDDLVDLQLIVDGLYLDPRTYQPSAPRRAEDAKKFAKALQ